MTLVYNGPALPIVWPEDAHLRLALPSARWLRVLEVLIGDFGPVPVFVDGSGTPSILVLGGKDHVAILFATVPETILASLPGRRAWEVIGHPAFSPGSRNGELPIIEAITASSPGEPAEALVLTFGPTLDITGARSMDELLCRDPALPTVPGAGA